MIQRSRVTCPPSHSYRVVESRNNTGVLEYKTVPPLPLHAVGAAPGLFKYWEMAGYPVQLYSLCTGQKLPADARVQWWLKCSLLSASHTSHEAVSVRRVPSSHLYQGGEQGGDCLATLAVRLSPWEGG